MNKNLVIYLQSRDKPSNFIDTVNMLYNTCMSKDNFDIVGFIDDDQIELYSSIPDLFPNVKWVYCKHTPGKWTNLVMSQYEYTKNHNYYFIWVLIDDFRGLSKNWDQAILEKKDIFKDGIFTLHQSKDAYHGRFQWIFDKTYILNDEHVNSMSDERSILAHCELLPIHTKKWIENIYPLFKDGNFTSQQDLVSASVALCLKKRFNTKRLIRCDLTWEDGDDTGNTNNMSDDYGKSKDISFLALANNDFELLNPIINSISSKLII
jgi:hypothetical protein